MPKLFRTFVIVMLTLLGAAGPGRSAWAAGAPIVIDVSQGRLISLATAATTVFIADPTIAVKNTGSRRRARELIPDRLPDVFEGDQVVVLGQYVGDEPLEFTLRGNYRGTPRVFRFRLSLEHAATREAWRQARQARTEAESSLR